MNAAKTLFFTLFIAVAVSGTLHAAQDGGKVEVTFDYKHQGGFASNQFAAWIQDAEGTMVKTLYVTDFTARRDGWKLREEAIPDWVRVSGVAAAADTAFDAVSGATPASGKMRHEWDCRDASGVPVPAGVYTVVVEGSLRGNNRAVFSAPITIGGGAETATPEPRFYGNSTVERDMITNVEVHYIP